MTTAITHTQSVLTTNQTQPPLFSFFLFPTPFPPLTFNTNHHETSENSSSNNPPQPSALDSSSHTQTRCDTARSNPWSRPAAPRTHFLSSRISRQEDRIQGRWCSCGGESLEKLAEGGEEQEEERSAWQGGGEVGGRLGGRERGGRGAVEGRREEGGCGGRRAGGCA